MDGVSNPSLSQLRWEDENEEWRQRGGEAGRAGQGELRPQFRIGRTRAPKSDKAVIQTRFMCSAADCGSVEAGEGKSSS